MRHQQTGVLFAAGGGVLFVASLAYGVWSYTTDFGGATEAGSALTAITVNVFLFSAFAFHHSLFARPAIKAWLSRRVPERLERSTYVWIASAMFIVVCRFWRPVSLTLWHVSPPWSIPLQAFQLLGLWITALSSRRLDVLALAGLRQALGQRPANDASLITNGWYRVVRHPIYLGWVLMVWPTPHMSGSRLVFACVSTAYLALAIPFEERALIGQFGERYREYASRVRARMVPFLY